MSYIQDEILKIRADQINAKNDNRYQRNYKKQLILFFVAVAMVVAHCYCDKISRPHCSRSIDIEIRKDKA